MTLFYGNHFNSASRPISKKAKQSKGGFSDGGTVGDSIRDASTSLEMKSQSNLSFRCCRMGLFVSKFGLL